MIEKLANKICALILKKGKGYTEKIDISSQTFSLLIFYLLNKRIIKKAKIPKTNNNVGINVTKAAMTIAEKSPFSNSKSFLSISMLLSMNKSLAFFNIIIIPSYISPAK